MKFESSKFRKFICGEYSWKVIVLRLIIIMVATVVVCKMTAFGWQDLGRLPKKVLPKDRDLPDKLKTHVIRLAGDIGDRSVFQYTKLNEAANYITGQFKNLGFQVEFQEYQSYEKTVKNIIVKKHGKEKSNETIVIGAHYDTCFNPGADDNASAVAVLLELARLIAERQYNQTIELVAFVNEEPPFYRTDDMGSLVYARKSKKENKDIKVAIVLETIGYYSDRLFSQKYPLFLGPFYPNRGNFIGVVGNLTVRQSVSEITKHLRKYCPFMVRSIALFDFIEGVDFSDHWAFWQMGFPAVMITDTAFYRNPYYHTNGDTFEKLDYNNLALLVEALEGILSNDL